MTTELANRLRSSVADFYRTHGRSFAATRATVWPEQTLVAQRLRPGMQVVDVGAGNGRFARLVPEGAGYVGFEPSDTLRETARGLDLRPGRLPHLPCPDACADVTVCFAVFHHLAPDQHRPAVAELIRITTPGGLLAVTSWYIPPDHPDLQPVEGGERPDRWMSWKVDGATSRRYVRLFDMSSWKKLWTHPSLRLERIGLFGKQDWTDDPATARNWCVIARTTPRLSSPGHTTRLTPRKGEEEVLGS